LVRLLNQISLTTLHWSKYTTPINLINLLYVLLYKPTGKLICDTRTARCSHTERLEKKMAECTISIRVKVSDSIHVICKYREKSN